MQVIFKKGILSKRYADHKYAQRPKQCDHYNVNRAIQKSIFNGYFLEDESAKVSAHAAAKGKGAENEEQLPAVYFPFLLKAVEHGCKSEGFCVFPENNVGILQRDADSKAGIMTLSATLFTLNKFVAFAGNS